MADTLTLPPDPEVLAAWRSGPRWFHVVVALIDDDEVESRRRDVAAALGSDVLATSAPGQAHVTIWAAGFEPLVALPDSGRISLQVGVPSSFTSAAYLTVTGTGVQRVRSRLTADAAPEVRDVAYVPHVTVGTYVKQVPMTQIDDALLPFSDVPPIPVVGHIRHLVVDTRSPVGALVESP